MKKEFIRHAAIRAENGMIFIGKCHADCFKKALNVGLTVTDDPFDQGFFTSKGRFINRVLAAKIAYESAQITERIPALTSEDLWDRSGGGLLNYDEIKGYYHG